MDEFEEIFAELAGPQIGDLWRKFAEDKNTVIESCAERGFTLLQGADIGHLRRLAVQMVRDLSDALCECLKEAFVAARTADSARALSSFNQRIKSAANGVFQSVIETIDQVSDPPPESRVVIMQQFQYELDGAVQRGTTKAKGRLKILVAAKKKPDENPFLAKPTFFGFGVDLMKIPSWLRQFFRRS